MASAPSLTDGALDDPVSFIHAHLIPIFFLVVGCGSVAWMVGFKFLIPRALIMRAFRSLGVSLPRTRKALQELKRKSFHLAGLLIPFIYYLGLNYSGGLITRPFGLVLLGLVTAFLWTVEILRYVSPAFRGHYNRIFSSIMRKQELQLDPAHANVQEGTLAYSVDQLVQSITTPLLGELPPSPSYDDVEYNHTTPHFRGHHSASASPPSATSVASSVTYDRLSKAGSPSSSNLHSAAPPASTNEKTFTGTGFFFLGNWLAMFLFEPTVATVAMLHLILGDLTAAIIGISFGTIKIGSKSLEGTVAMFLVCFTIGSVFFSAVAGSTVAVFIAALAATLVELLGPPWADDNLTIPMASGLAFSAVFYLTHGGVPHVQIP